MIRGLKSQYPFELSGQNTTPFSLKL